MKKPLIIALLFIVLAAPVGAEILYVTGDSRVNLRSGNSTRDTIIEIIDPGQELRVMEHQGNWAKVQMPDGKEGWMVGRFLTDKKPAEIIASECRQKLQRIIVDFESLQAETDRLIIENQSLHEKLEETLGQLNEAQAAHETLTEQSADFLSLQAEREQMAEQLREKTDIIASLENQLTVTNRSSVIHWFLAGAGVLILGMVIGAAIKRKRAKFI
jgi:SH3 domain protein